jgi:competence protein ComFC
MSSPVRPAYHLYRWIWTGLDWLYPPRCAGCGQSGSRWCANCQASVKRLIPPLCPICSQPVGNSGICGLCRASKPRIRQVRAWGCFDGSLRHAIHALKYRRDVALGEVLSTPLVELLKEMGWGLDLVIPVPLGMARLKARGYNQAALLALPLALMTGLTHRPQALKRTRETHSQVGLSLASRHANVQGAFTADDAVVAGKRVLVIDDVITTGATMHACASALMQVGAKEVYGLALARAV